MEIFEAAGIVLGSDPYEYPGGGPSLEEHCRIFDKTALSSRSVAPLQCLTKLRAVLQAVLCYNLLLDFGSVLVSIYLHSSKEGSLSRSDHRSDSVSSVSFERSWKTTTAYVITLCINNLSQITHISPT